MRRDFGGKLPFHSLSVQAGPIGFLCHQELTLTNEQLPERNAGRLGVKRAPMHV